ncbi:chitobiase/beta-hexosaminidase C-terminal domain-containing protein [Acidicapsa acidisoli]|uniref:chitobiase/beta-hexosaminidase C-terminal domain-containing protein n=1 Tax=Acidicapsa acidisoli TaxID=1615681 RepID=UPI0021DF51C2|nr:chitobiase/beta-hexosaminidase C-terminal domain-containing protein [Acidicapsa acidisoli]
MQQAGQLQAAQQMQQDMLNSGLQSMQVMQQQQSEMAQQQQMLAAQQSASQLPRKFLNAPTKASAQFLRMGQPAFSVKSGQVDSGTRVRIKWRTTDNFSTVYYSTDGWTPTTASVLYKGPIRINATTHLQAIGVGPNSERSEVSQAYYIIGSRWTTPIEQPPLITDGKLRAGNTLQLVTVAKTSSDAAKTGDRIPLVLDQDVKVGDSVVVPKGTPVDAVLTVASPSVEYYTPGILTFEVRSLSAHGKSILLRGGETMEGADKWEPEAVIKPGMALTATVAADVTLEP